jgi:hypothetical protein
MIRAVGRKLKLSIEPIADREITTEADYFARKCGLTREEAQRILDEANLRPSGHTKKSPLERSW